MPLPSRPVREHGPCDSSRSKMTLVAWLRSCFRVSPQRGHPLSAFPCCSAASGLTSRLTCPLADEPCGRDVRLPRRVTAQGQASSPPLRTSPRTIGLWSIFPCGQSESPRCPGCWPLILKQGCRAWWLHSPRVTRRHSSPYVSETKPPFPEKGLSSLRPHPLTPADPPHRPRPRRSPRPPSQPALRSDPTRPDPTRCATEAAWGRG